MREEKSLAKENFAGQGVTELLNKKRQEEKRLRKTITLSWVISSIAGGITLAICIYIMAIVKDALFIPILIGAPIVILAFLFSFIMDNNFIQALCLDICSASVKMPMVIFSLDIDGCLFLIGCKLLFAALSALLTVLFCILAFVLGLICGIFVFPYAVTVAYIDKKKIQNEIKEIERKIK